MCCKMPIIKDNNGSFLRNYSLVWELMSVTKARISNVCYLISLLISDESTLVKDFMLATNAEAKVSSR